MSKEDPGMYDMLIEDEVWRVSSKTGIYKYDNIKQRLVKVSDKIPNVCVFSCHVPEGGYYSENLETFVESRSQKRRLLKEKGLREMG